MSDDVKEVIKLQKPITVHGEQGAEKISELKLKEPPGKLVLHKGSPYSVLYDSTPGRNRMEIQIIPELALEYLVAMSGHDAGVLEQLSASDVRAAHQAIIKIMNPTEP